MMKWIAMLIALVSADALAWRCEYERTLDESLDVRRSDVLDVAAAAGDLDITGVSRSNEVSIRGRICVSDEDWLDKVRVGIREGDVAKIYVESPDSDNGWSLWGNRYAYVDLVLEMPADLALQLRDSSGDIEIESVDDVEVTDSSGDLEIRDARGNVEIKDSSGDITVRDLGGDLTIISDSSGNIRGNDIEGSVLVLADSSGHIGFSEVGRDVVVEKDSSGDITVASVGGDFSVLRDGSGQIHSRDVKGEVNIPEDKD